MIANGEFDVALEPAAGDDIQAGRMLLTKTFHGDLEGSSTGQMLSHRSEIDGSAGYVAIEHVTGSLLGKRGTFVLQHSSTMARGAMQQSITVVPDSATGDLEGLTGQMVIDNSDGKHAYRFEYSLPD